MFHNFFNHNASQADKCSWSHDCIKIFHCIRLRPVSLMLWRLMPNREQWCTSTVQCFPNKVLYNPPNKSFQCLSWSEVNGTLIHDSKGAPEKKNIAKFILKTHKRLTMYFPIDDVVRVTLVMMVSKEKWACRDSTEKPGNWADKEKQVWKINLTAYIYEYDELQNYNSPVLVLGRASGGKRIQILYLNLH